MNERQKVCVFCSHTQGFHKMLEFIRKSHEDAYLLAVFPHGHVITAIEQELLDEVLIAPVATNSIFKGPALLKMARELRRRQLDELIVSFESLKLRLFIVIVRPQRAIAWISSGAFLPLSTSLFVTLWDLFGHRVRGYGNVLRLGLLAWVKPIRSEIPDRPDH